MKLKKGGAMALVIANERKSKMNGAILLAGMMGPIVNKVQVTSKLFIAFMRMTVFVFIKTTQFWKLSIF